MTRQETLLTLKASTIIGIVSVVLAVGMAYAVTTAQVDAISEQTLDQEGRLRIVEACLSSDLAAIRADIRWIVYTLEDMK
jgi:hypothetical protein